jgi:DNA-binding transcriptional LysR family regulator
MELRQIKYFVAVAEELHFRRAAQKLHVAQPAISEQIRKLEAEIGTELFLRSPRHVQLTDAGAAFLHEARTVLRQLDVATDAARITRARGASRARVGCTPYGPPATLAAALGRLCGPTSRLRYELRTGLARPLLMDVRHGILDAALVTLPAPVAGLRVQEVRRHGVVAAARADAGLDVADVTPAMLAGRRLLTLGRPTDPAVNDAIASAFHQAGVCATLEPSRAGTVDQLLLEVAAGAGIALLPEHAAQRGGLPGVRLHPVDHPAMQTTMVIVTRDEAASPALTSLVDELAARADQRSTAVTLLAA